MLQKLCKIIVVGMMMGAALNMSAEQKELVFVGSGHKNITAFWLDLKGGELLPADETAEIHAPSFLAISPNRKFLYAVSEGHGLGDSAVSGFRIEGKTGKLAFVNREPTGGAGPCHVWVDQRGRDVLAANYNTGSEVVFPIDEGGSLGERSAFIQNHGSSVNKSRQEGPHAHCIVTSPNDRYAYVCDLGLDQVLIFKFDSASGTLSPNEPAFAPIKPGSGPRHIAFHPNRRFAYVISEMAASLTVFSYDKHTGALTQIEDHLLPEETKASWAAEVAVHPNGRFVFGSNRGDNTIIVYRCDPKTGRLTFIERDSVLGKTPRHFEIDPSGKYLLVANQDSGNVVVFRIDTETGHLQATGHEVDTDQPMCVKCLP